MCSCVNGWYVLDWIDAEHYGCEWKWDATDHGSNECECESGFAAVYIIVWCEDGYWYVHISVTGNCPYEPYPDNAIQADWTSDGKANRMDCPQPGEYTMNTTDGGYYACYNQVPTVELALVEP